jgi:uncharacterized protein (TIGR02466 family)
MICEEWFPVPIWYTDFKNITDQQYEAAVNYCESMQGNVAGSVKSNVGGWQSQDVHMDSFYETPLSIFRKPIDEKLAQVYRDMGVNSPGKHINVWVNINKKSDYNKRHTHPNSHISGVFYITDTTSDLVFERPSSIASYHTDIMSSEYNTPFSFRTIKYTPRRGMLIMFPSWLTHWVEPNGTYSVRISIAFNTRSY